MVGWQEKQLTPTDCDVATAVIDGSSIVMVPSLATGVECQALIDAASRAAEALRARGLASSAVVLDGGVGGGVGGASSRIRLTVAEHLDDRARDLCQTLLRRTLVMVEAELPVLAQLLLDGASASSLSELDLGTDLVYADREPAVNVYEEGGCFKPHEDKQT